MLDAFGQQLRISISTLIAVVLSVSMACAADSRPSAIGRASPQEIKAMVAWFHSLALRSSSSR